MTVSIKQLLFTGLMGCLFGVLGVVILSEATAPPTEWVVYASGPQTGFANVPADIMQTEEDCRSRVVEMASVKPEGIFAYQCREEIKTF